MTGVGSTEPARSEAAGSAGGGAGDLWNDRAQAYRDSATHASGDDLDLVVAWCEPAQGVSVLDVATGGGHVARRLREAGAQVVTVDAAPGMEPDVIAPADHLPFADASLDAVACRIAAHHFPDVLAALKEMARVARHRIVICDNVFVSESSEEADRLRDPSHVRNYGVAEWESFFELAGLEVAAEELMQRDTDFDDWLARTETPEADRAQVRKLLGDRVRDGRLPLPTVVLKGIKAAA
jgi:SAM-dependent methyltransferase